MKMVMSMKWLIFVQMLKQLKKSADSPDKDTSMNVYWRVDVQLYLFFSSVLD